jgi:hypothetical protein
MGFFWGGKQAGVSSNFSGLQEAEKCCQKKDYKRRTGQGAQQDNQGDEDGKHYWTCNISDKSLREKVKRFFT